MARRKPKRNVPAMAPRVIETSRWEAWRRESSGLWLVRKGSGNCVREGCEAVGNGSTW